MQKMRVGQCFAQWPISEWKMFLLEPKDVHNSLVLTRPGSGNTVQITCNFHIGTEENRKRKQRNPAYKTVLQLTICLSLIQIVIYWFCLPSDFIFFPFLSTSVRYVFSKSNPVLLSILYHLINLCRDFDLTKSITYHFCDLRGHNYRLFHLLLYSARSFIYYTISPKQRQISRFWTDVRFSERKQTS